MASKKSLSAAGETTPCASPKNDPKTTLNSVEALAAASIEAVRAAQELVEMLAAERAAQKLSKSRVSQVARELRDILKVLTRYCAA